MKELMLAARAGLATALQRAGHQAPESAAALTLAVFDGFLLHKGLDPESSTARIAPLLRQITDTRTNGAR